MEKPFWDIEWSEWQTSASLKMNRQLGERWDIFTRDLKVFQYVISY